MNDDKPEIEEVDMPETGEVATVTTDDVDVERGGIEDFISSIETQNFTDAEAIFNGMIGDRLQATLDQAKMRIAGQIYNGEQEIEQPEDEEVDVEN